MTSLSALQDNGSTDDYGHLKFQISASGFDQGAYITSSALPFYNDEFWSVMLTRKDTDGNEFTHDNAVSQSVYELTTKQYNSTQTKDFIHSKCKFNITHFKC